MPKSLAALLPLELGPGDVLLLLLESFRVVALAVVFMGTVLVAGGDLLQGGVLSALCGSRLMVKLSKLECPFTPSKWLCPFSGALLEFLLCRLPAPLLETLLSCCVCGSG